MLSGPRSENEQNRLKPWSAASLARPTVGRIRNGREKAQKAQNGRQIQPQMDEDLRRWRVVGGLAKSRILRSFAPIERKISIENLILARNSVSAFRYY
jgi:hypothetical protein